MIKWSINYHTVGTLYSLIHNKEVHMKKTLLSTIFISSLFGLTACEDSSETEQSDPYEILSGSWEFMEGPYSEGQKWYIYFDGDSSITYRPQESGCFIEETRHYPYVEHVEGSTFKRYLMNNNGKKYLNQGNIVVGADGTTLTEGWGLGQIGHYSKFNYNLTYFTNHICE